MQRGFPAMGVLVAVLAVSALSSCGSGARQSPARESRLISTAAVKHAFTTAGIRLDRVPTGFWRSLGEKPPHAGFMAPGAVVGVFASARLAASAIRPSHRHIVVPKSHAIRIRNVIIAWAGHQPPKVHNAIRRLR